MSFELDDRGADEIDAQAAREGVPFGSGLEPGFLAGAATAAAKGLFRGVVAKPAALLGDAATPVLRGPARAADKALGTSLDAWLTDQQQRNARAIDELRPDPLTTGFAGQVLGGFLDIGGSAALFTPEGAAVLEGYARKRELEAQGVSPGTAAAGGAVSGVATLVGVKAPMTLGRTAVAQGAASVVKNMGFGAAANISAGVAERGTLRDLLERSGFHDQARMFEPYDQQAMLTEGALGALFSGGAAALELRSTARVQRALDAALAAGAARHRSIDVAPGVPTDSRSMAAHARAMDAATAQVLGNEPVSVGDALADTTFVRSTSDQGRGALEELQLHVADLLPEPPLSIPADAPRGIRANNPGNIRATSEQWQGQAGAEGGFVTFETPEAGIRAIAKTLITYNDRHGLNTVDGIVARWAPAKENDTAGYATSVAQALGVKTTARLDLRDPITMRRLVQAIVRQENSQQPYPDTIIRAGVDSALSGRELAVRTTATVAQAAPPSPFGGRVNVPAGAPEFGARVGLDSAAEPRSAPGGDRSKPDLMASAAVGTPTAEAAPPVAANAAQRFPRVSDLEPIATGPAVVQPREIASGRQLYRETSTQGLSDLLIDDQRAHVRQIFVTDSPDLAIGQGQNKGVQVVFREGSLSGTEHVKPGTGDRAGREYQADMVAPRAIESFTVPAGFKPKEMRGLARRALDEFDARPQPDGSVVYARKPPAGDTVSRSQPPTPGRTEPVWAANDLRDPATPAHAADAAAPVAQGRDPAMAAAAAAEVVAERPDMLVALEDGTEVRAAEVLARAQAERVKAEADAQAFEAAVSCFLRNPS